jgi:hypothetical protein
MKGMDCARQQFPEVDIADEQIPTEAAIRFLETFDEQKFVATIGYIRSAPREAQTPVRTAVNNR